MKFKLALSLLLVAGLSACSTSLPSTPATGTQQTAVADIEAKTDLFDVMLLSTDANGNKVPVTPDQISSLRIDGKAIAASAILLPGTADSDSFSQADKRQQEAAKAVNGQPVTVFGGNGAYTFVVPKTGKNSVLELQLKGQSSSYQLIRFANLSRGTFVLGSNGQVQGGFNTNAAFTTKAEGGGVLNGLSAIFANPSGYYALAQFTIGAFQNFYQGAQGEIKVTTQDHHELTFQPTTPDQASGDKTLSSEQANQVKTEVTQAIGADLSSLLFYLGSWTLESDLLKALIPGNQLTISVANGSAADSYRLTAALASGAYSGESKVSGGGDATTLNLSVSSDGKSVGVQIHLVSSNRISIKLTDVQGAAELSGMVGTEIFLKRVS